MAQASNTTKKKPLHVFLQEQQWHQLDEIRTLFGLSSKSETVRWLIAQGHRSLVAEEVREQ